MIKLLGTYSNQAKYRAKNEAAMARFKSIDK